MPTQILIVDAVKKHRQVVRSFLEKSHPEIGLTELDPIMDTDINWAEYNLLIIDNLLGDQNGIKWVEQHQNDENFPPFIFLSSAIDPYALDSSIQMDEGLKLGAESFLYKKHLKPDKLNYYVSNALEKSGAFPTMTLEDDIFDDPEMLDDSEEVIALGNTSEAETISVESTYHQMSHARALLDGYAAWPFDIRDLHAGKAELDGYHIDTYLGKRDDVCSFSAHRQEDKSPLVIKLIDRSTTQGKKPPEELIKDLEILINIKHQNLVRWISYKASNDYILIAQELLEGKKLSKKLKNTGVTEAQAVDYMLQILSGLQVLHSNGIYAGALSPDNLLFRDNKTIVQTHLNCHYYPKKDTSSNGLQFNYQEALYMPPEMIQGRQVDHRSDLYIAGIIFFHMLAGTPPYHGNRTQDVITEHIAAPVPPLPGSNHPMEPVIQSLMMKTPSQRTQSAAEVITNIQRIYDH